MRTLKSKTEPTSDAFIASGGDNMIQRVTEPSALLLRLECHMHRVFLTSFSNLQFYLYHSKNEILPRYLF